MNTRSEIEGLKREIERLEGENKNLRLTLQRRLVDS